MRGLPTTVFINVDGTIHDKWAGALSEEVLIEKTGEMLENEQPITAIRLTDDCDQLLRNQLKFQKAASTASRMNEVIRQVQNQRDAWSSSGTLPLTTPTTLDPTGAGTQPRTRSKETIPPWAT